MKKQAEKHIIDNYGENWLKIDWDVNDVIDIMISFAEKILKEKIKEANKFIRDIARLLGEDNLDYDEHRWTIEDFKDAIVEIAEKAIFDYDKKFGKRLYNDCFIKENIKGFLEDWWEQKEKK